jgi:hypothetical protein
MTKDDIDKLWHQAMNEAVINGEDFTRYRFANLVAAAQKEADAKLIEEYPYWLGKIAKQDISAAIRARGNT